MDFACGNVIGREVWERKPPGVTPYNGLYGKALPERDTFFRVQVYKWVRISQAEVHGRVWKSVT